MTMMRSAFLEDLPWPDAAARIVGGAVVIVPAGAAAKAHGPYLPLRTDYLMARELVDGLIAMCPDLAP
jgi:creatinine amidohydrolase/Fe(II)-dependent formamide hydrolase-like protein